MSDASLLALTALALAAPSKVEVVPTEGPHGAGFEWRVDGEPFVLKGAGGSYDKEKLAAAGATAFRTWGVGPDTPMILDEAERLGLKVVLGIWLGHERHGFDYGDPEQVKTQLETARQAVLRFRDHPALLAWGVGNEMEGFAEGDDPQIWRAVEDIAAMIQRLDANHPTITVTAEIGGARVRLVHELCPSIDVVGINSYGGARSLPKRYREAGGSKPYLVTEFGPPGAWETSKTAWGAPEELTSTEKAKVYAEAYRVLAEDPLCVGSFAFTWGFKQEATATWFGMVLPDGTKLGAVDAMAEAWGRPSKNSSPEISRLRLSAATGAPTATITAQVDVRDPEGDPLETTWVLYDETPEYMTGGDFRPTPPHHPEVLVETTKTTATLRLPERPGGYRLYAFVRDGQGGGAVANAPIRVKGRPLDHLGAFVNLPLVVYDEGGPAPFAPSGWMGEIDGIHLNPRWPIDPRSGDVCLEIVYRPTGGEGWAGVAWQNPPNNWGEVAGGYDLRGAEALTFWIRGGRGGEKLKIGFGLLGVDKAHPDSARDRVELELSTDWTQVRIPLGRKRLERIQTGLFWAASGDQGPIRFFLDDVRYE